MKPFALFTLLFVAGCGDAGSNAGGDLAATADLAIEAGDLGPGATCTFNRDCIAAARCECDVNAGCACALGVRGTGQNGVDACVTGNDCASALCVEGPGGGYVCSDACVTMSDCTGLLPQCLDVAFLGRICVRQSP